MSEIELPQVQDVPNVKVVRLRPNDTVVCLVGHRLMDSEVEELRESLKQGFPGYRVAVLDGGATIEVLRAKNGEVTDDQR